MLEHPAQDTHTVLVVGEGEVATALTAIAAALGWRATTTTTLEETLRLLPEADSVVVLSHHGDLDGPALAAAIERGPAYLGAMGSRKTQSRRREWLLERGVAATAVDAVRGPAGLDIGANTPAEIAVSIAAEIVAVHRAATDRVGGSLRDRGGPIHPDLAPGTAECPAG